MSKEPIVSKHPDVLAWEEFKEKNPESFRVDTITHRKYLENRLQGAFYAGIKHAEIQIKNHENK